MIVETAADAPGGLFSVLAMQHHTKYHTGRTGREKYCADDWEQRLFTAQILTNRNKLKRHKCCDKVEPMSIKFLDEDFH